MLYNKHEDKSQDKEVQIMLLAEKYAMSDIATMRKADETKGRNDMLYELVSDGDLTVEKGANKIGISTAEFMRNMQLCGYHLPE